MAKSNAMNSARFDCRAARATFLEEYHKQAGTASSHSRSSNVQGHLIRLISLAGIASKEFVSTLLAPTGNGEKLSSSQLQPGRDVKSAYTYLCSHFLSNIRRLNRVYAAVK